MNGMKTGLILCAWLLLPALAAAQSAPAQDPGPGQRTQMYEDIEILRRLLNSKLQAEYQPARQLAEAVRWTNCASCHDSPYRSLNFVQKYDTGQPQLLLNLYQAHQPFISNNAIWSANRPLGTDFFYLSGVDVPNPNTSSHWLLSEVYAKVHPALPGGLLDTEGVYLKGQGVIYTLTLPPPPKSKADAAKPAPKPVSDWDRVRRELRHEKPEAEGKERPRKEPTLSETILQVLAENGHHFGQLGENESLTVVVTFRGVEQAQAKAANTPAPEKDPTAQAAPAASSTGNPGQDYELLGDLHLKQGKTAEAERAYLKALGQSKNSPRAMVLWGKIAQTLLHEGKVEEAQQMLEQARDEMKKEQATRGQPAQPREAAPAPLPAKLIITAPKKLLEQAAGGRMSLEQFRQGTTVEYLNFSPPQD